MQDQATNGPNLEGLSDSKALDVIALLIDQATDEGNLTLIDHALALADQLQERGLRANEVALLDYFRANAWACRYQQRHVSSTVWEFEQPEVREQVFLLRRAAYSDGFMALAPIRQCQILTNLSNQLDTLGRFVEARSGWNAAIAIDPDFWMARANRAQALMSYGNALYDPGHRCVFAYHAHWELTEAVELITKHPHLGDHRLGSIFAVAAEGITAHYDVAAIAETYRPAEGSLGRGEAERAYRRWCLANALFLNPLNDVDKAPIAARDVMNLPDFILPADQPPIFIGMFNELKQTFASARWLLWEGASEDKVHCSDRGVMLFDTFDYPSYGLAVEKVKMAFRLSYSLFDKIAYFLNSYLDLGLPAHKVNFRTMWRDKGKGPLHERIALSKNWPLRGLYWLSKDLFEEGMKDSTEPHARALAELRNHLEHKYVKVQEFDVLTFSNHGRLQDTLAFAISRSDLTDKALRLLQLARSALIYLSLAMHHEERQKSDKGRGLSMPISLDVWRDEWKR